MSGDINRNQEQVYLCWLPRAKSWSEALQFGPADNPVAVFLGVVFWGPLAGILN